LGNIMGVKDEEAEAEGMRHFIWSFVLSKLDIHVVLVSIGVLKLRRRGRRKRQGERRRIIRAIRSLRRT
jgi:hypothetical protein